MGCDTLCAVDLVSAGFLCDDTLGLAKLLVALAVCVIMLVQNNGWQVSCHLHHIDHCISPVPHDVETVRDLVLGCKHVGEAYVLVFVQARA